MRTYKAPMPPLQNNQRIIYGATSKRRIMEAYSIARQCKGIEFIIPYTAAATGIPGVDNIQQLATWFAEAYKKRDNLLFEESFAELIEAELQKHTGDEKIKEDE